MRRIARIAVLALATACRASGIPVNQSAAPTSNVWSVIVLGDSTDVRYVAVTEAVAHWNSQFDSLRTRLRFGSVRASTQRLPDQAIEQLRASVRSRRVTRPRELDSIPGDVVIAFGNFDGPSFGYAPERLGRGFIGLRAAHGPPLSLPNVARNTVAHELGHALGLGHNNIPGTLMCSGPPACRPGLNFRSDTTLFLPLTPAERSRVATRGR